MLFPEDIHWASGRMEELGVNTHNPHFCHVQRLMKPSMKSRKYRVYILLRQDGEFAAVAKAVCECAAGYVWYYNIDFNVCVIMFLLHIIGNKQHVPM